MQKFFTSFINNANIKNKWLWNIFNPFAYMKMSEWIINHMYKKKRIKTKIRKLPSTEVEICGVDVRISWIYGDWGKYWQRLREINFIVVGFEMNIAANTK